MSIHYAKAETAEEIAQLLRTRGRIVITAPARVGKTTELLRYAEERYPNGRFTVVADAKNTPNIIELHWLIYNGMTRVDVVAKRLLGEELEGDDVIAPDTYVPEMLEFRKLNPNAPVFVDEWFSLPNSARRAILKHKLFIAAVTLPEGE